MSLDSRRPSTSHKHWSMNWWDLWPLVDGERRPLQWTNTSIIFTSHPLSPVVVARSFPSNSSFILPSPVPVLNNPSGYAPPSIIEVSPGDERVFAFFEGRGEDHVACIWHREETMDAWTVGIWWGVKPGQGFVSAKWLGVERTWVHTSPPTRTPPLGPKNLFGKPTLLLVTKAHVVQLICWISPFMTYRIASASLRYASQGTMSDPILPGNTINGPGGLAVCVKAAVGLGYSESSIIIATHSTIIPPASAFNIDFPDQFGVPPPTPSLSSPSISSWDNYGPQQEIQLCEVKVTVHNNNLGIKTKPLQPLFPQVTSSSHLSDMLIVPHLIVEEEILSSEGSIVEKSLPDTRQTFKPCMHIVLTYLDFEDYVAPKSALVCFELKRSNSSSTDSSKLVTWSHHHLHTRNIVNAAVTFLLPSRIPTSNAVVVGLLDVEGFTPRVVSGQNKPKDVGIGKIVRLRLPQMKDDENWEPSRLAVRADGAGTDLAPISAAMSPSESFICTSSAPWSTAPKLSVHAHPAQKSPIGTPALSSMSENLLSSILSNRPSTDIIHALANPTLQLHSVHTVLEQTFSALNSSFFLARDWHSVFSGIMLEVYKNRSKRISKETPAELKEQISMDERWHVALDICSMKALKGAFDACRENDGYDMKPIWHLISLLTWFVDFAERLIRACLLWEGSLSVQSARNAKEATQDNDQGVKVKKEVMEVDRDDLFGGELTPAPDLSISPPPHLIHLLHPYTLDNFLSAISHLNTFRAFLDTLTASRLKASLAKEVVVDVIDCSAINFKELESVLRQIKQLDEFATLDADTFQRSFCFLLPSPSTQGLLMKACSLVTSPATVSKPRLFIKPSELVDGISKLNLDTAKMNMERDVVSKGILGVPGKAWTCVRCHGKTETGRIRWPNTKATSTYSSWAVWEHEWERCICGGVWMKGAVG